MINIDFIREHQELHEIKKSKAIEEAGIWQVKYYLYYLEERGVKNIKGKIDYPLMKKTLLVELSEQDREKLKSIIDEIESDVYKRQGMGGRRSEGHGMWEIVY